MRSFTITIRSPEGDLTLVRKAVSTLLLLRQLYEQDSSLIHPGAIQVIIKEISDGQS